jgi:hypothetical protein
VVGYCLLILISFSSIGIVFKSLEMFFFILKILIVALVFIYVNSSYLLELAPRFNNNSCKGSGGIGLGRIFAGLLMVVVSRNPGMESTLFTYCNNGV